MPNLFCTLNENWTWVGSTHQYVRVGSQNSQSWVGRVQYQTRMALGGAHVPPTKVFRWLTASVNETTVTVNLFITTSMVDHDEEKRIDQNLIVHSRKSEAELALDVLYY